MKTRLLFLAVLSVAFCSRVQAKLLTFTANLTTNQTVPPSDCVVDNTPCYGTATLVVDTVKGAFSLTLKYATGAVAAMHLDRGDPGTNGKILVLLEGNKSVSCGTGVWCRDILITDDISIPVQNIEDLIAGRGYIVVFSSSPQPRKNPDLGGAIRGQLQLVP